MTGYAVAARELTCGAVNLELRAVNHRYLDAQFRLPDELRVIEPQMREALAAKVSRGKLDCRVQFTATTTTRRAPQVDEQLLQQVIQLDTKVRIAFPSATSLSVADILRWPGILGTDEIPTEEIKAVCLELLDQALDEFNASRAREGDKLKLMLAERAGAVERLVEAITPRMPELVAAYRERLTQRLNEALAGADDERVRQEVALFASKIDVDEELSRLKAHIEELRHILRKGGAAGKRLDFLMQELNREANTLGSKSNDTDTTRASVELKVLIEQMREQIQNIE
jgi:uncharacterized protein (TIGR00255 family)